MGLSKFKSFFLLVLSVFCSFGLFGCVQQKGSSASNVANNSAALSTSSSLPVLSASDIYRKVNPSTVFVLVALKDGKTLASGTGFFIDNKGNFVTNYHVIKTGISGSIQLYNGETAKIDKIVGYSEDLDIAVLHAAVSTSVCSGLGNSDSVSVGDTVYAIGYPEAFVLGSGSSTFTSGMVSMNRSIDGHSFIQSTVDITNGNSGGPLIDSKGQIVGITTGGIVYASINYMNLSIPVNRISSVAQNLSMDFSDFGQKDDLITASFYINGNRWKNVQTKYNTAISDPNYTATVHDRFDGWFEDSAFSKKYVFSTPLKKWTDIYGKLVYVERQLVISSNDSDMASNISGGGWYKPGSSVTVTATEKLGKTFLGWYLGTTNRVNLLSTDKSYSFSMPDSYYYLLAKFEVTTYLLTIDGDGGSFRFYYNGGTNVQYQTKVIFGESVSMPTPTKDSCGFEGWYKGNDRICGGGETYKQNVYGDVTLKAHWTSYYTNFSLYVDDKLYQAPIKIYGGDSFHFPNPVKAGCDFLYWVNQANSSLHYGAGAQIKITGLKQSCDLAYYAVWSVHRLSLTFASSETNQRSYSSVYFGDNVVFPNWTRTGYSLTGWSCAGTFYKIGQKVPWNTDYSGVFSAVWSPNVYQLTPDCDGGSVSPTSLEVTYDKSYSLPMPVLDGYEFVSWYSDTTAIPLSGVWKLTNTTLKAKWKGKTISVVLDVNGGDALSSGTLSLTYGDTYQLPTPTKTGMDFAGWVLADGTVVANSGTWSITKDVALVASWKEKSYSLAYAGCGDSGVEYESEPTLSYTLNSDGASYTASGLGSCTKTEFIVGGYYLGLPVTEIGTSAFDGKNSFTKVLIGKTISKLGAEAFRRCNSSLQVYFESSIPPVTVCDIFGYTWDTDAFKAFAPTDAMAAYQSNKDLETGNNHEDCWQTYLIGKKRLNAYDVTTLDTIFDFTKDVVISSYSKSSTVTLLVPTRTGYVFDGWYTSPTFEDDKKCTSFDTALAANVVLYAKWTQA
jgi:uncharacterized repeat protein (TIGR02543 family)